jgi:hypothetical protein
MIKKIWKDPVWSKVIAGVTLITISFIYVIIKSITSDISFQEAFQGLVNTKIRVVYVLALIFLYLILRQIFKKKYGFYAKNQKKLLRQFNKHQDTEAGLQYKWIVHFAGDTPSISNFTVFCTKHGEIPIKFFVDRCPVPECENSKKSFDILGVKNNFESVLIEKWDKLKQHQTKPK